MLTDEDKKTIKQLFEEWMSNRFPAVERSSLAPDCIQEDCKSKNTHFMGTNKSGSQRVRCRDCARTFSVARKNPPLDRSPK